MRTSDAEDSVVYQTAFLLLCKEMEDRPPTTSGRAQRVRKNLKQGMALAWAASPRSLIRYTLLGILSSAMPPIAVYLGARLVNRIADAQSGHALHFTDMLPIVIGLWIVTGVQRAVGAYMGYGRNLFVRRITNWKHGTACWRRLRRKYDLGRFGWRYPTGMIVSLAPNG